MRIISPGFEILTPIDGPAMLRRIEAAGRTCYKSENKTTVDSVHNFIRMILSNGHETVIEHEIISVRITCDRGVSHEIVRHRLASYSQESTRFCNYSKDKFGSEITIVDPRPYLETEEMFELWLVAMERAEQAYFELLELGAPPQMARSVLPNSLKTEIVMTCNLREWRHFFRLRTATTAHPQMRQIAGPILYAFQAQIPVIFDDIGSENEDD